MATHAIGTPEGVPLALKNTGRNAGSTAAMKGIVKSHDNLQDAARCLVSGISRMRTKPKPPKIKLTDHTYYGDHDWMAL